METTLRRQIGWAAALVFALALAGVSFGQWLNTRHFVREQLANHTQETATALALSLSVALREGDEALIRTTVLPVFDRGYHRRIVVADVQGRPIERWQIEAREARVPDWFAAVAGLEPPTAGAMVTAGWRQVGRVEVEADPQLALQQLWRGTLHNLGWLLAALGLGLAAMRAWLRELLAPLQAVERAAEAAAQRRYEPIELQPRALELRRFVGGFNRLVDVVRGQLQAEEERAERFRLEALRDVLTGLPNRAGLEVWLAANPDPGHWLGLVEVSGLEGLNRLEGFGQGDAFVVELAQCLQQCAPGARVARLRAATFALVCCCYGADGARAHADAVAVEAARLARTRGGAGLRAASGWVPCPPGSALSAVLGAADRALATALQEGSGPALALEEELPAALRGAGAADWQARIARALEEGRFTLSMQPVRLVAGEGAAQREFFLRLVGEEGALVPVQAFLPLMNRRGASIPLDRQAVSLLEAALRGGRIPSGMVAVNLAAASWRDEAFKEWLAARLAGWPREHPLVVEIREADAADYVIDAERFAAAVRAAGAELALDHFGVAAGGLACLRRLLPHYVKLDAALARGLEVPAHRFHVEALVRSARTLEILVWAQVFEEEDDALAILAGMGVSGAQGYRLAAEEPVPA